MPHYKTILKDRASLNGMLGRDAKCPLYWCPDKGLELLGKLKHRRAELHLTLRAMAKRAGVSHPMVAAWERDVGIRPATATRIQKLAKAYVIGEGTMANWHGYVTTLPQPTEPGWYWYQGSGDDPEVVHVKPYGNDLVVYRTHHRHDIFIKHLTGEWGSKLSAPWEK